LKAIAKGSFIQDVDGYNMTMNIVKRHLKNLPRMAIWGTHKKLRVENTRKHKRYNVKAGIYLLQTYDSKKTFSAEVIDFSEGGL